MNIPSDLRYTADHEWAKAEADDLVRVGITDHAQDALGDVVYVELPAVGTEVEKGAELGVVDSSKAASEIYAPVTGTVVEVNENLDAQPGMLNDDPYGEGWLCVLKLSDGVDLTELLTAESYGKQIEE